MRKRDVALLRLSSISSRTKIFTVIAIAMTLSNQFCLTTYLNAIAL
ncbi:hypothetical protein LC609_08530 [Nostoc sp. XA013]|nr:hypothetical protein [Nostoc sp. XA013]